MERYSYPHTVENGAGERITFIRKVAGAGGERLEVESVVKPGAGPPMHIHRHQDAPRLAASATHTRTVAERLACLALMTGITSDRSESSGACSASQRQLVDMFLRRPR